jgi:cation:H+ antiporter
MTWLGLSAGLVLLLVGGEFLVRGGVGLARRLGVSPLLVGLVVVGFGTSMPELITSLDAARAGSPGIALGNVVGSNIANILLILGLSAVIAPLITTVGAFRRDGLVLLGSTGLLIALAFSLGFGRVSGALFLAVLLAYTVLAYLSERRRAGPASAAHAAEAAELTPQAAGWAANLGLTAAGLAALLVGAQLLVASALTLAAATGLSETTIGLTLVAVGTSLPELAISLLAAWRGHGDVAFGNIVGSNIFNALGILGVTSLLAPLAAPPELLQRDLWVLLAATSLLLVFAWSAWRLARWEGALFLAGYGAYLVVGLTG